MAFIELKNIDLDYYIYGTSSRSLKTSLLKAATGGLVQNEEKILKVQALHNVSFKLEEGDRLGIVGHNGAGKSSLLRLLAQIYDPSRGKFTISGKTNCLFDVMVGLDPNLSGIENIKLRGLIHGLSSKQTEEAIPEIIEFAELGDFIQMPIRTYSSGMVLRLGFSIATHFKTEILLIDEVVNVGDAQFLVKAKQRLRDLINRTKIVVVSTHDEVFIKDLCNKIVCLDHGKLKFFGSTDDFFRLKESPEIECARVKE